MMKKEQNVIQKCSPSLLNYEPIFKNYGIGIGVCKQNTHEQTYNLIKKNNNIELPLIMKGTLSERQTTKDKVSIYNNHKIILNNQQCNQRFTEPWTQSQRQVVKSESSCFIGQIGAQIFNKTRFNQFSLINKGRKQQSKFDISKCSKQLEQRKDFISENLLLQKYRNKIGNQISQITFNLTKKFRSNLIIQEAQAKKLCRHKKNHKQNLYKYTNNKFILISHTNQNNQQSHIPKNNDESIPSGFLRIVRGKSTHPKSIHSQFLSTINRIRIKQIRQMNNKSKDICSNVLVNSSLPNII